MKLIERAQEAFKQNFNGTADFCGIAPGRIEVLGNHTDYNEGYILAAAIDREIILCGRKCQGSTATIYATSYDTKETFDTSSPKLNSENFWINYIQGVVNELNKQGVTVGGFEAVLDGNVPLGAGLSSSAALEVATTYLLKAIFGFTMEPVAIALTAQAAENKFVGMNCGILDQFSSAMGKEDNLVYLDCRDLNKYRHIPLGNNIELVIANTKAQHSLVDGAYNQLRSSCFYAAKYYSQKLTPRKITHLRDVSVEEMNLYSNDMSEDTRKRAKHIITENQRVLDGVTALERGDLEKMGKCMNLSHISSRDDFGNSCEELDIMYDCAENIPGLFGRRLSGGGFGGCTVNLVSADKADNFAEELTRRYIQKTGIKPEMHICKAWNGAHSVAL